MRDDIEDSLSPVDELCWATQGETKVIVSLGICQHSGMVINHWRKERCDGRPEMNSFGDDSTSTEVMVGQAMMCTSYQRPVVMPRI